MDLTKQEAHPVDVKREVQKEQALSLRIARGSYRSIARALGVSVSTAHELVTEALAELKESNREQAAELKALESSLLDQLTVKLWPKGENSTLTERRAEAILKIRESFRRLHGLDAPVKGEWSGPGGGPIPVAAGVLDLAKLSVEQLRALEAMYNTAGGAAQLSALNPEPEPGKPHA